MRSGLELGALDSWPTVPPTMNWVDGGSLSFGRSCAEAKTSWDRGDHREQGAQGSGFTAAAQGCTRAALLSPPDKMAAKCQDKPGTFHMPSWFNPTTIWWDALCLIDGETKAE